MNAMTRNTEEVKRDVVDQLYWDGRIDATDVQVEVSKDKVVLSGTVPTLATRHAADEDAWLIRGVKAVDNQLDVRFPTGMPVPRDETIATNVNNALLWHPDIDSTHVTPTLHQGRVTLRGSVGSYWQKVLAGEIVSGVQGVLDVVNELAVVPSKDISDQVIASDIISGLERNAYVDPETIRVTVQNGLVTLTGAVGSVLAYRSAHSVAQYTEGVVDVINKLTFE